MQIVISGQTPAKKNSKEIFTNRRTGRPILKSNAIFEVWQNNALRELKNINIKFKERVQIDYMFYVANDVQRDLDNMIASVNDALQLANADYAIQRGKVRPVKGTGIVAGDNWQLLRIGSADAEIDRLNPRVVLTITEIPKII